MPDGKQVPWMEGSPRTAISISGRGPQPLAAQQAAPLPLWARPLYLELSFWDSIKGSSNPADLRAYLSKYPQGQFAELAQARSTALAAATAEPAPAHDNRSVGMATPAPCSAIARIARKWWWCRPACF